MLLPRTEREVVNLASMIASELVVGARNHTQFIVAVTVEDLATRESTCVRLLLLCKCYSNLCEDRRIGSVLAKPWWQDVVQSRATKFQQRTRRRDLSRDYAAEWRAIKQA